MCTLSGWEGGARCCLTCAGWLGFPTSGLDSPPRCWIGPSAEVASFPWCFSSGRRALAQAAGLAIASSLTFDLPLTPFGWALPWPYLCWDCKRREFFVVKEHHKLLIQRLLLLLFFCLFIKQTRQRGHLTKLLGCNSSFHLRRNPQNTEQHSQSTRRSWLSYVPADSARGRRCTAAAHSFNSVPGQIISRR